MAREPPTAKILEEITDSTCAERLRHQLVFMGTGKRNHLDVRIRLPNCTRGSDAIQARHPQIHQNNICLRLLAHADRLGARGGFSHQLQVSSAV